MVRGVRHIVGVAMASASISFATAAAVAAQQHDHAHMNMKMDTSAGWQLMQDGVVFVEFNHQGSPRGGQELVAPNWWMGMASRNTSHGRFTFDGMLSLEPATVGADGYREIFQAGEAFDGRPIVDRQHPHDFFVQLAATWRTPIGKSTGLTIAGAPVGEPALGPVAFVHRASALDNPDAPLSHHVFDSTHISFGVVTAAVDHGPWTVEGSVFNGREPDEHRWDFDFGKLDSVSGRVWFSPNAQWTFQFSSGRLTSPEQLEPGNATRTTASASWTRAQAQDVSAFTIGYGRHATEGGARHAVFAEGTRRAGLNTVYGRFEILQLEGTAKNPVAAFTAGGVRDMLKASRLEGGLGADVTLFAVADALQPMYGAHPVSFHIFFRLRPSAGGMGRMLNMRMAQP